MGLGADLQAWRPQVEHFRRTHDLLLYDHRGVGGSPRPRVPRYGIARLADDAAQLLDRLGVPRAHFVGISLGGLVIQQLAIRHPERVASLALASTYARPARHLPVLVARILGSVAYDLGKPPLRRVTIERATDALLRAWAPHCFSEGFAERERAIIREEIRGTVERNGRPDVALLQLASILRYDARKHLRTVRAPAWVVIGDQDRMVPMQRARELADAIPGARFEIYPGVGHGLTLEAADRFNRALGSWIAEVENDTGRRSA